MKSNKVLILIVFLLFSFQGINAQTTHTDEQIRFKRDRIIQALEEEGLSEDAIQNQLQVLRQEHIEYYEMTQQQTMSTSSQTMSTSSTICDVPEIERQALIDFYNYTDGPNWTTIQWDLNDEVCNWAGITVLGGHVVGIDLYDNNLTGLIPSSFSNLTGLTRLELQYNNITGGIDALANCTSLSVVRMVLNENLGGNYPNFFKNFTNIVWLDFFKTSLTGEMDDILPGQYPKLKTFNFTGNNLIGGLPLGLENLPLLESFAVTGNNNVGGTIPIGIGNSPSLLTLFINACNLDGQIPTELGNLNTLERLVLEANNLTGGIPGNLAELPNLSYFTVERNKLSGKIPAFQNIISSIDTQILNFESNEFIFSDFETEHPTYQNFFHYSYSPQAKVDEIETMTVSLGSTLEIGTELYSPNNTYQWYHNGVAFPPIEGVNKLIIENVDYEDAGTYYYTATNSVIDSLTLERYPITVEVVNGPVPGDCTECYSFKPVPGKNYILSGWVKEVVPEQVVSYTGTSIGLNFKDGNDNLISSSSFYPSGEIIETWQRVSNEFTIPPNTYSIEVVLSNQGNVDSHFDDIRIHPFNGSMKSFVYDPVTQRLMAELDENNYSTYYEYDLEGGLIRTKKETERGVYTIQEARSKNSINN